MTDEKGETIVAIAVDEASLPTQHAPVPREEVVGRPSRQTMIVGDGVLTWPAEERRSDRYGFVMLLPSYEAPEPKTLIPICIAPTPGTLWVEVTETRHSDHVGDLFRGIAPRTPQVGDWIKLGTGKLMYGLCGKTLQVVGLVPEPMRTADWMSPRALYDATHQTVILHFEPAA